MLLREKWAAEERLHGNNEKAKKKGKAELGRWEKMSVIKTWMQLGNKMTKNKSEAWRAGDDGNKREEKKIKVNRIRTKERIAKEHVLAIEKYDRKKIREAGKIGSIDIKINTSLIK